MSQAAEIGRCHREVFEESQRQYTPVIHGDLSHKHIDQAFAVNL